MSQDEQYQQQLDKWAATFADTALGLMPDFTDAAGVLAQAAMLVCLKHMTPMEYAEASLAAAEDNYARISAAARPKGGLQ